MESKTYAFCGYIMALIPSTMSLAWRFESIHIENIPYERYNNSINLPFELYRTMYSNLNAGHRGGQGVCNRRPNVCTVVVQLCRCKPYATAFPDVHREFRSVRAVLNNLQDPFKTTNDGLSPYRQRPCYGRRYVATILHEPWS